MIGQKLGDAYPHDLHEILVIHERVDMSTHLGRAQCFTAQVIIPTSNRTYRHSMAGSNANGYTVVPFTDN